MPQDGPILIASNHPGSFFDAFVVGAYLKEPIHTLTRGDVFKNPKAAFWLRQINLIPVFRGSEGRENLNRNDTTLDESINALRKKEALMIFSEGVCIHEWHLRPLGKGTARIAHQAWYGNDPIKDLPVIPTGLTYEHFRGVNKRVVVKFGPPIFPDQITSDPIDYEKWLREFNAILKERMEDTILQIPREYSEKDKQILVKEFFDKECPVDKGNTILRLLGKIGRAIHRPIYQFLDQIVSKKTARSVFYDSVLFGLLLYPYPILVVTLSLLIGCFTGLTGGIITFILIPLLAFLGNRYR